MGKQENTEPGSEKGTALLIAAAPTGKGRLVDAASVLPALAVVPAHVLTGTSASTVIELADPIDPQTVLTRIRAAAAAPGPLALYLAGQLHLDHRQHQLHVALARTTRSTLRYTALPWPWLAQELAARRPGTTTVLADLFADAEAWRQLQPAGPALAPGVRLYGHITPPGRHRQPAPPAYLKAIAAMWRGGTYLPLAQLHEHAAAQAGIDGALLLAVDRTAPRPAAASRPRPTATKAPPPADVPAGGLEEGIDPHPAILTAAQAGRHSEAAAIVAIWESAALRAHGPGSTQAIHWVEVRADLARLAGDAAHSCALWMQAASARLDGQRQAADHPDVEAAVDRAHHQWAQLQDPQRLRALAAPLLDLRQRVPGRGEALRLLHLRLEHLPTAPRPASEADGTGPVAHPA
ncbi:hypothetical protein [Streptomyces odontomachi]|uniref:hypothetical protein n=1 Tax=Streptomyces odontomachi TaxID=2944940 RepID=UPI002108BC56|nr:hypothetical protein [Streptomyces sp. ODS25]